MEFNIDGAKEQVCLEKDRQKVCSLYERLQRVPDRRKPRGKRYEAAIVLTLLVLAKLAGEKQVSGIAEWARLRASWLSEVLPLRSGKLPCANTYQYVCDHIDKEVLDAEVEAFTAGHCAKVPQTKAGRKQKWRQLVLDGKVLRGSDRQAAPGRAAKMVVSAYEVEARRVCKQNEVAKKGQEPQAAMSLIEQINLQGYVVSADALHTRPKWCRAVRQQGGHYLLIVKGNRKELYEDIALLFEAGPLPDLPEQRTQTVQQKARSARNSHLTDQFCSHRLSQTWLARRRTSPSNRTPCHQGRQNHLRMRLRLHQSGFT